MSCLPIRLRLTLVFALAMGAVLAGLGAFVYLSMRSDLTASVDSGLRSRAGDVAALVEHGDGAEPVTSHGIRRQAGAITDRDPGRRLPVPPARNEIRRLGGTLNAMIDRLEGALARERSFVADASHEFRTPIAVLEGELELERRAERTPVERTQALDSAAEEADRLGRLAEDLLVMARIDRGQLPIRRESVDIGAALARAAERAARRRGTET